MLPCIALDNEEVRIRFDDDSRIHKLLWTELLNEDDISLYDFDEATTGRRVLAPWVHPKENVIRYAPAEIVDDSGSSFSFSSMVQTCRSL